MDHFLYHNHTLHAEGMSLERLAEEVGTPFYCYSTATFERHYHVFNNALEGLDRRICYAVKANSNKAILATLAKLGSGADVVSQGEIRLALAAGIPAERIVFSGVGKTVEEMQFALEQDIFQFNVESYPELMLLSEVAHRMGKKARIAVRINPDIDPKTHAKISTGQKGSKFGIPMEESLEIYRKAAGLPGIQVQGVSVHIGSQLTNLEPFRAAYVRVRALVDALRGAGHPIDVIDLGGGLGIPYEQDKDAPPLPEAYGHIVRDVFKGMEATFVFEPGRLIAGNAGILVSQVIYVKEATERNYVIVDAAMNDLMRPSLYDAYHFIMPVREPIDGQTMTADIVGPVCESGDTFAKERDLPVLKAGDLVAFRSAGAYGAVMSSTYNTRPLTPEVLVKGEQYAVIRPRPSYEEMLAAQRMPEWI